MLSAETGNSRNALLPKVKGPGAHGERHGRPRVLVYHSNVAVKRYVRRPSPVWRGGLVVAAGPWARARPVGHQLVRAMERGRGLELVEESVARAKECCIWRDLTCNVNAGCRLSSPQETNCLRVTATAWQ